MAKTEKIPAWDLKPGSDEFRLSKVDGRATVDVGRTAKFAGKLGPGWRAEKWGGRGWMSVSGHGVEVNRPGKIVSNAKHGDVYECECYSNTRRRAVDVYCYFVTRYGADSGETSDDGN